MGKISILFSFLLFIIFVTFFSFEKNIDIIKNYFYDAIDKSLKNNNLDFISAKLKGDGIKSTTIVELKGEVFDPQKKDLAKNVVENIDTALIVKNNIKIVEKPIIDRIAKDIISDILEYPKEDIKSDEIDKSSTIIDNNTTENNSKKSIELTPMGCSQKLAILLMENKIKFKSNSAILSKESISVLDKVIEIIKKCKNYNFDINGYTDNSGNRMKNLLLSGRRAEVVKNYLVSKGRFNPKRFRPIGFGPANPIADNNTTEGRAKNRRIEIVVIGEGVKK